MYPYTGSLTWLLYLLLCEQDRPVIILRPGRMWQKTTSLFPLPPSYFILTSVNNHFCSCLSLVVWRLTFVPNCLNTSYHLQPGCSSTCQHASYWTQLWLYHLRLYLTFNCRLIIWLSSLCQSLSLTHSHTLILSYSLSLSLSLSLGNSVWTL